MSWITKNATNLTNYLIGYKGQTVMDAGYFYAPYVPIMQAPVISIDDFEMAVEIDPESLAIVYEVLWEAAKLAGCVIRLFEQKTMTQHFKVELFGNKSASVTILTDKIRLRANGEYIYVNFYNNDKIIEEISVAIVQFNKA